MLIKVINGAHFKTMSFKEQRRNSIHVGTIVDKGGDRLAVHQDLANILQSQPPIMGVLIPVAAGSVPAGSYFGVTAGVVLGTWPPFAPAPPVLFNPFFSANAALCSFSTFRAILRVGFIGFLHSLQG